MGLVFVSTEWFHFCFKKMMSVRSFYKFMKIEFRVAYNCVKHVASFLITSGD